MSDKQYCLDATIRWPDGADISFLCYPAAYTGKSVGTSFPLSGKQINSLFISHSVSGVSLGHSYASIKANKDGTLNFKGRMADGSDLTGTARLVKNDLGVIIAPISFPISAIKGLLHGEGHVNVTSDESGVNLFAPSGLTWLRLPQSNSKIFKQGFMEKLDLYGQVWSWGKGQSAMPAGKDGFSLTLDPNGAVLEEDLDLRGKWLASNKPDWSPPLPKGLNFSLKPATGAISGKAPRTVDGKATKAVVYQGLLLNPGIEMDNGARLIGGGFILGSESSGTVEITTP